MARMVRRDNRHSDVVAYSRVSAQGNTVPTLLDGEEHSGRGGRVARLLKTLPDAPATSSLAFLSLYVALLAAVLVKKC